MAAAIAAALAACDGGDETETRETPAAAGAETTAESGYPLVVRDAEGRPVRLASRPERLVVVGTPLYTEIILDLGAAERLVAVSRSPDNPSGAEGIEKVGRPLDWSVEKVLSLEPDLVFGAVGEPARKLASAGIPALTAGGPGGVVRGIEDVYATIRTVDRAIHGSGARSSAIVDRLRSRIDAISRCVRSEPRREAAFVYAPRKYAPTVAGRGTPEDELLARAGARNAFADVEGYETVNIEELILRDPAVVVTNREHLPLLLSDDRLAGLTARKETRLFGVVSSRITSSRYPEVLEDLAGKLHPGALEE